MARDFINTHRMVDALLYPVSGAVIFVIESLNTPCAVLLRYTLGLEAPVVVRELGLHNQQVAEESSGDRQTMPLSVLEFSAKDWVAKTLLVRGDQLLKLYGSQYTAGVVCLVADLRKRTFS